MRPITDLIIHCTATPNGLPVRIQDIDQWHQARGFRRNIEAARAFQPELPHIGYHFFIPLEGVYKFGRGIGEVGAHCQGHNATSIGICMAGLDKFTASQWQQLRKLVTQLQISYPNAKVAGHRDYSPDLDGDGTIEPREFIKTCPGFNVSDWLAGGMQALSEHTLNSPPLEGCRDSGGVVK